MKVMIYTQILLNLLTIYSLRHLILHSYQEIADVKVAMKKVNKLRRKKRNCLIIVKYLILAD